MSRDDRVVTMFDGPSLTKQSHKDECDVNLIMKRFRNTEEGLAFMSQYNSGIAGSYGDFSNVTDYRTALEQVEAAKALFDALPSNVRSRFDNDPAFFLDFVHDPKNIDEMIDLGLAERLTENGPVDPVSTGNPTG